MKTRELSLGEKKAILKLRKEGKLIRAIAQALGIACTTTWNVLKKKETAGILSNRHQTGWPRKTTAVDDRALWRKTPKHQSVTSQTISTRQGWRYLNQPVQRRLREQQYRGYTTRCKPLISSKNRKNYNLQRSTEMSHKSSGTKFYGLMRPRLTSTKVMERPKCGERRDLLMIQNIQAHLWSTVEEVSWLGLAWLLLEWAH